MLSLELEVEAQATVPEAKLGGTVVYPGAQARENLISTEMEHRGVLLEQASRQEQAIQLEGRLGRGLTQKEKKRGVMLVLSLATEVIRAEEVERGLTRSGALLLLTLRAEELGIQVLLQVRLIRMGREGTGTEIQVLPQQL